MGWWLTVVSIVTILQALQLNATLRRIERIERQLKEHFPLDEERWNRWD